MSYVLDEDPAAGGKFALDEEMPAAPAWADEPTAGRNANPVQPQDTMGENLMDVLATVARRVNVAPAQLLDMPAHVVNFAAQQAGLEPPFPGDLAEKTVRDLMPGGNEQFMAGGWEQTVAESAGDALSFGMGAKGVDRLPGATATVQEIAGMGATVPGAAARAAAPGLAPITDALPMVRTPEQTASPAVMAGQGDEAAAGFTYDHQGNRVTRDPRQEDALKQDFDPGTLAMIDSTTNAGRKRMIDMLDILKKGRANKREQLPNRPSDIAGDSLAKRVGLVRDVADDAGARLDGVAKSNLQGQDVGVEADAIARSYLDSLEQMGVETKVGPDGVRVDFTDSDLNGLTGLQRIVKDTVKRLASPRKPDAYALHQLKRYLDEQITYGKSVEGLGGKTENALRKLRSDVDGFLDSKYPEYDKVNTQYSESINALNNFQDAAGRKIDLSGDNADKALGTASRKLLSNYNTRIPMMDSIQELESVVKKYSTPSGQAVVPYRPTRGRPSKQQQVVDADVIDDDLYGQVSFLSEMERMFGSSAPQSFQGIQEKAMDRAVGGLTKGKSEQVQSMYQQWKDRGKSEEKAIDSLERLLKGEDKPMSFIREMLKN